MFCGYFALCIIGELGWDIYCARDVDLGLGPYMSWSLFGDKMRVCILLAVAVKPCPFSRP